MVKVQDIRSQTPKRKTTRLESNVNVVVRHHSASNGGDFWTFWNNTWKKAGWVVGGYHEIILRDGTVQLCYDPNMITNGVAGHNSRAYHICVVGNGSFTEAQERAFDERAKLALVRFNLSITALKGHGELSPSACPGIDMNAVRKRLGAKVVIPTPKFSNAYGRDCNRFTCRGQGVKELQEKLLLVGEKLPRYGADGDFGAECEEAVKAFQARHGLVVDGIVGPSTLKKLDLEVNKMLQVISQLEKRIEKLEKQLAMQGGEEVASWAKDAHKWATHPSVNITDGTRPNEPVTRQEAWTMLHRAAGRPKVK